MTRKDKFFFSFAFPKELDVQSFVFLKKTQNFDFSYRGIKNK